MRRRVTQLATITTLGMVLVIVMGATVTTTDSAEGCGRSWPLCHGQFIPEFAVATLIEFSHRLVTGIEGLLIAVMAAGVWYYWRQHREIQILVPAMVGFLLLQSGMGAWAVMAPQSPPVLALHFGISLSALASVLLTTRFIQEVDTIDALRDRPTPSGYRFVTFASIVYILVVVYLGAYVRHLDWSLACGDWPLCNGQVFPGFSGPVGLVFTHRLGALGGILLLGGIAIWTSRFRSSRPDLFVGSLAAFGLILMQSLSGAIIVFSRLGLFSSLLHAAIMALLFAALSYNAMHVLPRARVAALEDELPEPTTRAPA